MDDIKHAAIVPLMGGFSIAATEVLNKPPEAIFSWKPFYDNDKIYLRYLDKQKKDVPYIQIDEIEKHDISHLIGKLDIVSAVPPCSGLSMSGNLKKGERENSPVNDWMINAAKFTLSTLKPTTYVFENAPTLFTGIGEKVRNTLVEIAKDNGYGITFYKTDTMLHGIPQRRPRTYTIFVKGDKAPILKYEQKELPSIADYLKQIPTEATLQDKYTSGEPYIKDYEIVKFCKLKFGDNWRQKYLDTKNHLTSYDFLVRTNLLEEYKDYVYNLEGAHPSSKKDVAHVIKKMSMGKNFRLSHRVLCIDKHYIYAVVGEMMERNIHPTEDRRMNVREYLHFMGLPHNFELESSKEYNKIPQNCPVATNKFIIKELVEIIKGNRRFYNKRVLMQNNIKPAKIIESKSLF